VSEGEKIRLGLGERCSEDVASAVAQLYFFEAIHAEAPEVFEDLRDNVLEVWKTTPGSEKEQWSKLATAQQGEGRIYPWLIDLAGALAAWGERWHVDAPWIYQRALDLLRDWEILPAAAEDVEMVTWNGGGWSSPIPPGEETLKGWDPAWETEADFDRRIEEHKRRLRKRAAELGYRQLKAKDNAEHFAWLARYQFHEDLTFAQVAESLEMKPGAVEQAIKRAAALLELSLRPSRGPGRPEGRKDSPDSLRQLKKG